MNLGEQLKRLRSQAGLSQEKLAEKLGVSRQAVTKWETNAGLPDPDNLLAISALFHISIDELLANQTVPKESPEYLYESITEYDIDEPKRYDMKLDAANSLHLSGYDGEKIRVILSSNTLSTLQSDYKVKIDDTKRRIDVDIRRKNNISEAVARESLMIFVQLPNQYIDQVELSAHADQITLSSLTCSNTELDIKTPRMILDGVTGTVEINCNLDMNILCLSLNGEVAVNQVSASSRISVPQDTPFHATAKGIGTKIYYEKNGSQTPPFCVPDTEACDNTIELNGVKSELMITTCQ